MCRGQANGQLDTVQFFFADATGRNFLRNGNQGKGEKAVILRLILVERNAFIELLAKSTGCNSAAIRSILNTLQKAGIISVVRGVGGAHLSRNPEVLTVWEVYRALEPDGLEHFIGFHPNPSDTCPVGKRIASVLQKPYGKIGAAVQETMEGITLQQLLDYYHDNNDVTFDCEPQINLIDGNEIKY